MLDPIKVPNVTLFHTEPFNFEVVLNYIPKIPEESLRLEFHSKNDIKEEGDDCVDMIIYHKDEKVYALYEGSFDPLNDNMRLGEGTLTDNKGTIYKGTWSEGELNGFAS